MRVLALLALAPIMTFIALAASSMRRDLDADLNTAGAVVIVAVAALLVTPMAVLAALMRAPETHGAYRRVRQAALAGALALGLVGASWFRFAPMAAGTIAGAAALAVGVGGIAQWFLAGRRARLADDARGMAYAGPLGIALFLSLVLAFAVTKL